MSDTNDASLKERIAAAITDIPSAADLEPEPDPEDEIVAAIERQLDVLEGTIVTMSNVLQLLALQAANLRAEVGLFSQPGQEIQPGPVTEVRLSSTGHVVAESVPEAKREAMAVAFCGHPDSLIVQTADGPVKVCPECDDAS